MRPYQIKKQMQSNRQNYQNDYPQQRSTGNYYNNQHRTRQKQDDEFDEKEDINNLNSYRLNQKTQQFLQNNKQINLNKLSENELYSMFKTIEAIFQDELKNRLHASLAIVSDFNDIKDILMSLWEHLYKNSILLTSQKEIDKRLWALIRVHVDILVKTRKSITNFETIFDNLTNEYFELFKKCLEFIKKNFDINNEEFVFKNPLRRLISNCFSYLGELLHFREKILKPNQQPDVSSYASYFIRAATIYPHEGKYSMLLSSCSKANGDIFTAYFWSIKAHCAENPYTMKENMQEILEQARITYNNFHKERSDISRIRQNEIFKYFGITLLRFENIIFTKIGVEDLSQVSSNMFIYLDQYFNYIGQQDDKNLEIYQIQLYQISIMIVFIIFHSIEGYDLKYASKFLDLNRQITKIEQIDTSDVQKECLRYCYGLIHGLIEYIAKINKNVFLDVSLPILYYLSEHLETWNYVKNKYPKIRKSFIMLFNVIKKRINQNHKSEQYQEHKLLAFDKNLLGFIPLRSYFLRNKTTFKGFVDEQLELKTKEYIIYNICEKLLFSDGDHPDYFQYEQDEEEKTALEDVLDFENTGHTINLAAFGIGNTQTQKTLIVIDGQNVAIRFGSDHFSSKGLKIVVDYWLNKKHPVQLFLPDFCFSQEAISKRREQAQSLGENNLKNLPDDPNILIELKKQGIAHGVPNWNYDDSYLIEYAKKKNAYIITNDRYNDHIEKYSKNKEQREQLKKWIRNNSISFTFVGEDFIPNPDFLNANNID